MNATTPTTETYKRALQRIAVLDVDDAIRCQERGIHPSAARTPVGWRCAKPARWLVFSGFGGPIALCVHCRKYYHPTRAEEVLDLVKNPTTRLLIAVRNMAIDILDAEDTLR